MKRIKYIMILMVVFMLFTVNTVQAKEVLPEAAEEVLEKFMTNLKEGDEEIYYYTDNTNSEMYNNIQQYLHHIDISYKIKNVTKNEEGSYTVKLKISAEGDSWKISGVTADIKIEDASVYGYVVTDTTIFDIIGPKNVTKFVFSIFGIVGISIIILALIIIIVIVIIVLIVLRNKKKA